MHSAVRIGVLSVLLALPGIMSGSALAGPKDYCEAYARDFADEGPKDEATWKARQANALKDCLAQFSSKATAAPAAKPAPVEAAPAAPEEAAPAAEADAEPAVVKAKPEAKPESKKKRQARKQVAAPDSEPAVASPNDVIVAPDIPVPEGGADSIYTADAPQQQQAEPAKKPSLFSKFFGKKPQLPKMPTLASAGGSKGKPTPGSAAWLDYCDRKYASFDRSTGTYQSYNGVQRKCKVTSH
ncbi:MAG: BA14K family protein [Hyphomicrobiales bacterium]